MNKASENTTNLNRADIRKQEIRDDIETIGRHATWLLGILTVIIIALASFIFKNLDIELETANKLTWVMWHTAIFVCGIYSGLLLYYMYRLVAPNFDISPAEDKEYEGIQEKIIQDAMKLKTLSKRFKTFLYLFVASAPVSFLYALALWHLAT